MPKNIALCSGNVCFISLNSFCFTALKCNRRWNPDCMGVGGKIHINFHETTICAEFLSNIHCMGVRVNLCLSQYNEVVSLLIGWRYMQANSYSLHANKNFFITIVYHIVSFFSKNPHKDPHLSLCSTLCFSFSEESVIKALYDTYLNVKGFLVSKNNSWMFLTIARIHSIFQMDKIKRSYLILSYWIQ